jgi:hypothetical protein
VHEPQCKEWGKRHLVSNVSAIYGAKSEHPRLNSYGNPQNLSRHTDLLCELETSLLMRGVQIGEMSRLGWLIVVKHAIWADSLYFLYLLLLSISRILASSQPTL